MRLIQMIQEDLDGIFADWAEPLVYRVASTSLNVSVFEIEQSVVDTAIVGLIGNREAETDIKSRGQMLNHVREVLVRLADLPEDAPQLTDRFLISQEEYQIIDFELESKTGLITLHGVKR